MYSSNTTDTAGLLFRDTRVLLFDLWRVIAIAMVIFSHVSITIGYPLNQFSVNYFPWKTWGEVGVTLFLILSGLSLEYNYGQKKMTFGSYYLRRIIRIYPVYYMSLMSGLVTNFAIALWATVHHGKSFGFMQGFDLIDFLLTATGFNAFAGKWGGTLIWSSWFIGLIMTLYLFYPIISSGTKRNPWLCIFLLLFISMTSRFYTAHSSVLSGNPLQWFPLNRIFEFSLGVFLITVINRESFLRFNKWLSHIRYLSSFSALSFPLFLIHDPFRRFIHIGHGDMKSLIIGVTFFLFISIFFSTCALMIDRKIQQILLQRDNLGTVA